MGKIKISLNEKNIENRKNNNLNNKFIKYKLPSMREIEEQDNNDIKEFKEEEINESLTKIYQDEAGNMVNVKKLDERKKRGILFYLFLIIFLAFLFTGAYYFYNNYSFLLPWLSNNAKDIKLDIVAKDSVLAGEEFIYSVNYENSTDLSLENIEIKVIFPEKFIYKEGQPAPSISTSQNAVWKIEKINAHEKGKIEIKGKLADQTLTSHIILADMNYNPEGISSEYKKSASFENEIKDIGLDFTFDNYSTVLAGAENEINVGYKAKDENYIDNLRIIVNPLENLTYSFVGSATPMQIIEINNITKDEQKVKLKFKFKEKKNPTEDLIISFEYKDELGNYWKMFEKKINLEVIKSSLNLNLIINGSQSDKGINIGDTLNYSIVFNNKGETPMKDIVIMAVLESDYLDWSSLSDEHKGKVSANTISWSKEEIPELAEFNTGSENMINFSIKILDENKIKSISSQAFEVKSYAQFKIGDNGGTDEAKNENTDTKSNTIINKVNSDINLSEELRYFNEDNIAVGSGPLPPRVGQNTSYKLYWKISNNMHEINNLTIETTLPSYVSWSGKENATVGSIYYDSASKKVIWNIGRLPKSELKFESEFSLSVMPTQNELNQIIVIIPGAVIKGIDTETNSDITKTSKVKTSKLEDDDIAKELNGEGIVLP